MPNYEKDVEEDANDFIKEMREYIEKAIADNECDFDDIKTEYGDLRDRFHEDIIDRAYSPEDAIFILQNCENEEMDGGLWEGLDWREQLSARAAYTYGNDVWIKIEEIVQELQSRIDDAEHGNESTDDLREEIAETVFDAWEQEQTVQPIEKNSQEELELLRSWRYLQNKAGWWGGYPVGSSYIDSRCGTGHGMPDIKDFVDLDHEMARKLPHIAGKRKEDVEARIKELGG